MSDVVLPNLQYYMLQFYDSNNNWTYSITQHDEYYWEDVAHISFPSPPTYVVLLWSVEEDMGIDYMRMPPGWIVTI